ncbi:MAG TPA: sporulation membrane protein YtaF [Syntrophomonadaceae bacterium]|nr:sporulation membrane protein YtaF [Syntrophomonadaceae bacterium]
MVFWTLIFFACALSLDAFSAGFAYGLRRIRIPFSSQLAFLVASTLTVGIGILCGHLLSRFVPAYWGAKLGGIILFGIGLWWFLRRKRGNGIQEQECVKTLVKLQFASLAVIVQVLEEPACADLDASGVISIQESLLLGIALSLDALGASFAAALAGADGVLLIFFIGLFQQLFLLLGIYLGRSSCLGWLRKQGPVLAGVILCLLGLVRFFRTG